MTTNTNIGAALLESIKSKDAQQALTQVQQFSDNMRNVTVGADYVMWITEPVNLTSVHKALAEDLAVPPRLLAIRRSAMSRTQKGALLVQAMALAIKRVHNI